MMRWRYWGLGLPLVISAILLLPGAAQASSAPPVVSQDGDFCAVYVDSGAVACVQEKKDFAAAKSAAIGSAADARLAGPYSLGVFYDNAGRDDSAGSITFFGSADCTSSRANVDAGWVDTTTWKNRISSFQALSNCYVKVWYLTSYSGSTNGAYVYYSNNVDGLNDHVWSARFT